MPDQIDPFTNPAHSASIVHAEPQMLDEQHLYTLRHKDVLVHSLEALQPAANRLRAHIQCLTLASLIDYTNRHKDGLTEAFAGSDGTFTVLFDFGEYDHPGFCEHKAEFKPVLHRKFLPWHQRHGQTMTQIDFVEHLDLNRDTIAEPDAASLIALMSDLEGVEELQWTSLVRQNGNSKSSVSKEVQIVASNGERVSVPRQMTLAVPIYAGESPYKLDLRINVKLLTNKPSISYTIPQLQLSIDDSIEEMIARFRAQTEVATFRGSIVSCGIPKV